MACCGVCVYLMIFNTWTVCGERERDFLILEILKFGVLVRKKLMRTYLCVYEYEIEIDR